MFVLQYVRPKKTLRLDCFTPWTPNVPFLFYDAPIEKASYLKRNHVTMTSEKFYKKRFSQIEIWKPGH